MTNGQGIYTKSVAIQTIRDCMMVFSTLALVGAGCSSPERDTLPTVSTTTVTTVMVEPENALDVPIDNAEDRVTKKPFGLLVSKATSPVQPERFAGYHTGVDFETFDHEKDSDVDIRVICDGPLLMKKWATGYGGVTVQKCSLENEAVTVVYGHLRLASISQAIGHEMKKGDKLGVLGKGYSSETDNERKHLHLGIHKSATVDIRGYVSDEASLTQWLDIKTLF